MLSIGVPSKAKWFVVRKPSTGELIAKSANQMVLPKIPERYKNVVTRPLSTWRVEGGSGYKTKWYNEHQLINSFPTVGSVTASSETGTTIYRVLSRISSLGGKLYVYSVVYGGL